ncbi:uncharacterized protein LOC119998622 [Tripterygium wilfordii]|uniref:uncharacterized protein LOC119998622 n=1 Tax=Tripterygium wilfordii TaxID=458696 RepID=UPI0018F80968|nr:uncharacterized protein LOC119998622 [Tripterygium wilfordii]
MDAYDFIWIIKSSSNGTLKLEKIPFWGTTFDFDCSNRSLIFTRKIRKLSHLDQSWGDSTLPQNIKNYYFLFPSYFLSIFARPCSSPDLDRHHHLDRHHQSFRNYRLPLRFPPLSHHLEAFDQSSHAIYVIFMTVSDVASDDLCLPLHFIRSMDSQNSSYFTSLLSGGSSTDDPLFTQDYGDVNEYSPNVPQVTNTPSNTSSIARKNQRGSNFAIDDDMMLISAYLNICLDPVIGNQQKLGAYWERIEKYFNENKESENIFRTKGSLQHRWDKIQREVNKFCGHYAKIEGRQQSGYTDQDKLTKRETRFERAYTQQQELIDIEKMKYTQQRDLIDIEKQKYMQKQEMIDIEKNKEEERIMTTNTTDMPPSLAKYYESRKAEILAKRALSEC